MLLDIDLASLYGVSVGRLTEQVRRNLARFPADFMFQLDEKEATNLKSQFAISSWGGRRSTPLAFTEQGVAMLSSVLRSAHAVEVKGENGTPAELRALARGRAASDRGESVSLKEALRQIDAMDSNGRKARSPRA